MKTIQHILLFVLIVLSVNVFGQQTSWEKGLLVGKVKTKTEIAYEFDISDSINHDEFMSKFYLCGFVVDRMIHFADSIKSEGDLKDIIINNYDSLGYSVKVLLNDDMIRYKNDYDEQGRLIRRIREIDSVLKESVLYSYDVDGRISEERYWSHVSGYNTAQWVYDSEGRLLEHQYIDIEKDSVIYFEGWEYDRKGVLRKSKSYGSKRHLGHSRQECDYDSKGNVTFERDYDWGVYVPLLEKRTKYKYDKNDSIIKETCREVKWVNSENVKDTIWQEIDSTGQVVDRNGFTSSFLKEKIKSRSMRRITRNAKGVPIEEIYEKFESNARKSHTIVKIRYDDLGRVIEEERISDSYPGTYKRVYRYYKDTKFWAYYAVYRGEDYVFEHESLFFYDNRGNCIAHIQWMPETQNSEYYFNVYRYEYYE